MKPPAWPAVAEKPHSVSSQSPPSAGLGSLRLFTVDLEDWFHLLGYGADFSTDWESYESRVKEMTAPLLDLLKQHRITAIFYVLGWVAKKHPDLVRLIFDQGHAVGSHGYAHKLVCLMTEQAFVDDTELSLDILSGVTGGDVIHYRAPGFSLNAHTSFFFEAISRLGLRCDSSYCPFPRGYGGDMGATALCGGHLDHIAADGPFYVTTLTAPILELPISCTRFPVRTLFGGGYFRLLPNWLLAHLYGRRRYAMFYLHPRDVFADLPEAVNLSLLHKLRSYVGTTNGHRKLHAFLERQTWNDPHLLFTSTPRPQTAL